MPEMAAGIADRLRHAFDRSSGHGLLQLGAGEVGQVLPPVFVWWRSFAARYVAALCLHAGATNGGAQAALADIAAPDASELATLVLTAPIMPGAEYLTPDVLRALWADLAGAIGVAFAAAGTDLQSFLKELNPAWNLVGRVHFNLAENRRDTEAPFAFMATYTTQLSAQARAQHMPLGKALQEYAGKANQQKLLALLMPVQRAAERCDWLRPLVDAGDIYHPLRWAPADAARLLASVDALEAAGIVVRLPATWSAQRPPRPKVSATVGSRLPSKLGLDGLLDFSVEMTLNGESLSEEEIATLLAGTDGLVMLRGQWVEVDRARLERAMQQFEAAEALSQEKGLTFAEAMRMLAGPTMSGDAGDATVADWSSVTAGPWFEMKLFLVSCPRLAHQRFPTYRSWRSQYTKSISEPTIKGCFQFDESEPPTTDAVF
jgi:hypothetical protein